MQDSRTACSGKMAFKILSFELYNYVLFSCFWLTHIITFLLKYFCLSVVGHYYLKLCLLMQIVCRSHYFEETLSMEQDLIYQCLCYISHSHSHARVWLLCTVIDSVYTRSP